MPHLRFALLGCGNVGRALLAMLAEKAEPCATSIT